jgi:precorrin isomerase
VTQAAATAEAQVRSLASPLLVCGGHRGTGTVTASIITPMLHTASDSVVK